MVECSGSSEGIHSFITVCQFQEKTVQQLLPVMSILLNTAHDLDWINPQYS